MQIAKCSNALNLRKRRNKRRRGGRGKGREKNYHEKEVVFPYGVCKIIRDCRWMRIKKREKGGEKREGKKRGGMDLLQKHRRHNCIIHLHRI